MLWRAIVRQTYKVLRRDISPVTMACSVLPEEDAYQIEQTEHDKGRFQAVDQLINILIKLTNIQWTDSFSTSLQKYNPVVFGVVTKAREVILKEKWFSETTQSKWPEGLQLSKRVEGFAVQVNRSFGDDFEFSKIK